MRQPTAVARTALTEGVTMTFHVPSVDISAYVTDGSPEERLAVAAAIDHACRTVGFIQIHGHGIPPEIIDGLTEAMDAFFALDLDATA